MLFLVEMVWGFLYDTFRQLLTVLAVMLSRPDRGRFVVRDKHIGVPDRTSWEQPHSGGEAAFERL